MKKLQEATFFGADVDPQMVRLATMNLTLRGLDRVRILRRDALTRPLDRAVKADLEFPARGFDVILANPPFSGRLDRDRIVEDVRVGKTAQTELLFLQYMLNHLRDGGRCGVVVPEGVLFGSTGAHKELRLKLVENNTVEAVVSLPGSVFNPYSGVKTSVLVFRKGGATGRVMFEVAFSDSLAAWLRCIPVEVQAARIPLNRSFCCCCCACGYVVKARSGLSIISTGVSPR